MVYKHFAFVAQRLKNAVCHGFMEFCSRGCIVGTEYLVRPNYHWSERLLWSIIFVSSSLAGFHLLATYLRNYSENVYRVVYEGHDRNATFQFPAVGICELGLNHSMAQVDRALNSSLYSRYPDVQVNHELLRNFVNQLTFQTLHTDTNIYRSFINYTKNLPYRSRQILKEYLNLSDLMLKIRSPCEDFFTSCHWLGEKFDCCRNFFEIPTMLGKCFVFNSRQNGTREASSLVENIQIYNEPYRMTLTFTKPAQVFLLNRNDIPQTLTPRAHYILTEEDQQMVLEFTIIPTITDRSLDSLPSKTKRCISSDIAAKRKGRTYPYTSATACIVNCFVISQLKACKCINFYHRKRNAPPCKLEQYACLEELGFINAQSMASANQTTCHTCLPNCDDSEFVVKHFFYIIDTTLKGKRALQLTLLNYPTHHKKRQSIRQSMDKLLSLSGILCLFLGANVVCVIELLYICCVVLVKGQPPRPTPPPPTGRAHYAHRGSAARCSHVRVVQRKAIKLSTHKP